MPTRAELARERQIARERFVKARIAERAYARNLVAVGRHVGTIVRGFADRGVVDDFHAMKLAMSDYSRLLRPWALSVSQRMQADVSRRDLTAWTQLSRSIGSGLIREITKTPVGEIHRELLAGQVKLITTIPLEAAERVHKLTLEGLISGSRAKETQREIMRSGEVSAYNAYRIARTETSRTASVLTEARARYIESPGYLWRSSKDSDVRNKDGNPIGSHRLLEGVFVPWDDPPVASTDGTKAHAGCIYFCRCWPEPVMPDRVR